MLGDPAIDTVADDNLRQILDFIRADAELAATTDVIVTSDHGFATISKHDVDAAHHATTSFSARASYDDVPAGFLPPGFLAIDLAEFLHQPLYDPERPARDPQGRLVYQRVAAGTHPLQGHGVIGGSGRALDQPDAQVLVAVSGGSDLLYLPHGNAQLARRLVAFLSGLDYVGALFADDRYGKLPGALPLSSIALQGSSRLPRPVNRGELHDLCARPGSGRVRGPVAERGADRRYDTAAGAGHARQLRPRQYL